MLDNGTILDTGYVIYDPKLDSYITANVGIFVTERNAKKQCDIYNRRRGGRLEVVKVDLVVRQD